MACACDTRLPQEDGLELQHARDGEQHGGVFRHERRAWQDGVASRREKVLQRREPQPCERSTAATQRAASAHQEAASDGVTRRILRDARLNRARGAAGAGVRRTRHAAARTAELCVLANERDARPQGARSEPAPRYGGARYVHAETVRALHAPAASLQTERSERVHRRAAQALHDTKPSEAELVVSGLSCGRSCPARCS